MTRPVFGKDLIMKSIVALASAMTLVLAAGAASAQDAEPAPRRAAPAAPAFGDGPWDLQTDEADIHVEIVARGLVNPWGMAFLPDGGMLVTERPGRLRVIRNGTLDPTPIAGLPDLYVSGITGLFDVALHPDFARNRMIYFSYGKSDPQVENSATLAVARARWDGGASLSNVEEIFIADAWFGGDPAPEKCCGQGPASGSLGGRIMFDPDGYLFVSSGDRNYGEAVEDMSKHFGKILRINDDGSVPEGNPYVGVEGHDPMIWTTGHRNPLGLTYNHKTGEIWESEFGPRGGDEVNRILRGGHYGWMSVTQGFHYNGEQQKFIHNVPGKIDPVLVYGPPSLNPGNLEFYSGDNMPAWTGDLFLASFTQGLLRYDTDANGMPIGEPERMLGDFRQRWRDVRTGPDGNLYMLSDMGDGVVLKISPAG